MWSLLLLAIARTGGCISVRGAEPPNITDVGVAEVNATIRSHADGNGGTRRRVEAHAGRAALETGNEPPPARTSEASPESPEARGTVTDE